jgi:multisubunit Na+/H+ antiporter MnhG subunit
MILEFLQNLELAYQLVDGLDYVLSIVGALFIVYGTIVFAILCFALFRTKNLDALKAIHILSSAEVYAFVCGVIGVVLISNIYNLTLVKIFLFLVLLIFNGVTSVRLMAKTAYFLKLKDFKTEKAPERESK